MPWLGNALSGECQTHEVCCWNSDTDMLLLKSTFYNPVVLPHCGSMSTRKPLLSDETLLSTSTSFEDKEVFSLVYYRH